MRASITVAIIVFLIACRAQHDGVQEGHFQKRVHRTGWHVDLHGKHQTRLGPRERLRTLRMHQIGPAIPLPPLEDRLITALPGAFPPMPTPSHAVENLPADHAEGSLLQRNPPEQDNDQEAPQRNKLAIPAFIMALVAVGLGFGAGLWLVIAALVATFILGAIAAKQIRQKKQGGKGFVMAALTIAAITALFTAIYIAQNGLDQ